MTLTPLLLRAVALAGGLSLTVAAGFAAYNSLAGPASQGLTVPVAFTDAAGQHKLIADAAQPAPLTPALPATAPDSAVAPAAPPVMTAPDAPAAAAAPVSIPPPPPAVTIVRIAPAPIVAPVSDEAGRNDEHASKQRNNAQHTTGHRAHEGKD